MHRQPPLRQLKRSGTSSEIHAHVPILPGASAAYRAMQSPRGTRSLGYFAHYSSHFAWQELLPSEVLRPRPVEEIDRGTSGLRIQHNMECLAATALQCQHASVHFLTSQGHIPLETHHRCRYRLYPSVMCSHEAG